MDLCCATAAASHAISSPFPRHRPSCTTTRSLPSFSSFALQRDLLFNINFSSRSIRGIRVQRSMPPEQDSSYASVVKEKDEERTVDDEEGVVEEKNKGISVIEYSEDPVTGELNDAMDFLSKLDLKFLVGIRTSILVNFLQFYRKGRVEGKRYLGSIPFDVTMPLKEVFSTTTGEESHVLSMEERYTPSDTQEVEMEGETSLMLAEEQTTAEGQGHNSSVNMEEERHTSSLISEDKLEDESEISSWIMEEQNDNSQVILQKGMLPVEESSTTSIIDEEQISTSSAIMGMERLVEERPNSSVTMKEKRCTLSGIMEVIITEDSLNVWDENDKDFPLIERELLPASEHNDEMNFLSKPTLKLDAGETYSILAYGFGAFLTLWLSSAVVGALDSLPVLPKLMEVIGLGFTIWFSYRYLIFKRNRDELFAKIEDLKEQILGPSE